MSRVVTNLFPIVVCLTVFLAGCRVGYEVLLEFNEPDGSTDDGSAFDDDDTPVCLRSGSTEASPFANSDDLTAGTLENPFVICTLEQLNNIRDDSDSAGEDYLDDHFALGADIDASASAGWGIYQDPDGTPDSGDEYYEGFEPIGECTVDGCYIEDSVFRGSFYGAGFVIEGLYINRPAENKVALFRSSCLRDTQWTCSEAAGFIRNLELRNVEITGARGTASLVSHAGSTTINSITASGRVNGETAAGVVFDTFSGVSGVHSTVAVTSADNPAGGVVALLRSGELSDCSWSGTLVCEGDCAGVAGYIDDTATIRNSTSSGSITSIGMNGVGGIAGGSGSGNPTIISCYSTAEVTAAGNDVGGIMGLGPNGTFISVFSTGAITGVRNVGGILGNGSFSTISNCFSTGDVVGAADLDWNAVGGVLGANIALIENCHSRGQVSGTSNIGGLAGWGGGESTIRYTYSTSTVIASKGFAAGLIGAIANGMLASGSFATGNTRVNTNNDDQYGQLIGNPTGTPTSHLFYSSEIILTNDGTGTQLDQSTFATGMEPAYFNGPRDEGNASSGQIYEQWPTEIWSFPTGAPPRLLCPQDNPSTIVIDESWGFDCSIWENAQ